MKKSTLFLISILALNLNLNLKAESKYYDTPKIKGILISPTEACYFWLDFPIKTKVTIGCYINSVISHYGVETIGSGAIQQIDGAYNATSVNTIVDWEFKFDPTTNQTRFFISTNEADATPDVTEKGIF